MKFALTTLQVNMSHAAHRAPRSSLPCLLFLWHVVFWCLTLKLGGIGLFFMRSESAISSLHCHSFRNLPDLWYPSIVLINAHTVTCFCQHVWIYSPQASCLDSRFTGIMKYEIRISHHISIKSIVSCFRHVQTIQCHIPLRRHLFFVYIYIYTW